MFDEVIFPIFLTARFIENLRRSSTAFPVQFQGFRKLDISIVSPTLAYFKSISTFVQNRTSRLLLFLKHKQRLHGHRESMKRATQPRTSSCQLQKSAIACRATADQIHLIFQQSKSARSVRDESSTPKLDYQTRKATIHIVFPRSTLRQQKDKIRLNQATSAYSRSFAPFSFRVLFSSRSLFFSFRSSTRGIQSVINCREFLCYVSREARTKAYSVGAGYKLSWSLLAAVVISTGEAQQKASSGETGSRSAAVNSHSGQT